MFEIKKDIDSDLNTCYRVVFIVHFNKTGFVEQSTHVHTYLIFLSFDQ